MEDSTADSSAETGSALTVKGFIDLLATFPADARVVVDGYEDGYDNVSSDSLSAISIRHRPNHADWEGENEDARWDPGANDITAVRIARRHGF